MLIFKPVSESYEIEIPEKIFNKYMVNDNLDLYYALEKIDGVNNVDYNAEYGFNIFISVDMPFDSSKFHLITQTIKDHCNGELD